MLLSDEDFTAQFNKALYELGNEAFNIQFSAEQSPDERPVGLRMSSMGNCARQLYYRVAYPMEIQFSTSWQTVMGYAGQDVIANVLRRMGYTLSDEEKEVFFVVPGHVDGVLTGHDLGPLRAIWDSKIRNSFAYKDLVVKGLPAGEPGMYLQQQGYIKATKADMAILTIMPFDITDTRSRLRQSKVEFTAGILRIILKPDKEAHALIEERATMVLLAVKLKLIPVREYDPFITTFPCGFCEYKSRCMKDGQTEEFVVAPIPEKWLA